MKEKSKDPGDKPGETSHEDDEYSVEEIAAFRKKLESRVRHIQNVQKSARLLADRLAETLRRLAADEGRFCEVARIRVEEGDGCPRGAGTGDNRRGWRIGEGGVAWRRDSSPGV